MKQLILLFSFSFISFSGLCDTLDYWQVYINDKLLADLNEFSLAQTISIKRSEIKDADVITVKYGNDHPCEGCLYGIMVVLEIKQKLPEAKSTVPFESLSIPLRDLLQIQKSEEINRFPFYFFYETKVVGSGKHLFTLLIN